MWMILRLCLFARLPYLLWLPPSSVDDVRSHPVSSVIGPARCRWVSLLPVWIRVLARARQSNPCVRVGLHVV